MLILLFADECPGEELIGNRNQYMVFPQIKVIRIRIKRNHLDR